MSLNDTYYVYDTDKKPCLEVISYNKLLTIIDRLFGGVFTFGNKFSIKDLDGKELMTLKKKFGFLKEEYYLYNRENKIAFIKQQILSVRPKITMVKQNDNYLVKGDLMATSFSVFKNEIEIAQIRKVVFYYKDSYKINIFDKDDEFICIAMLIAIDNSIHN